jgi:uncharacterized membrane protein YphA (DoxX/SURF4 family)
MRIRNALVGLFILIVLMSAASTVHAHEVYVLNASEISTALHAPMPDFIGIIRKDFAQFVGWGILSVLIIMGIFMFSISKPIEKVLDPFLVKIKHLAPMIAQITIGLALIASGWYASLFGPELSFTVLFGGYTHIMQTVSMLLGAMFLFGIFPRAAGFGVTVIFIYAITVFHSYMLSYLTYIGEGLAVLIWGGGYAMVSGAVLPFFQKEILARFHKYSFLLMRLAFGFSVFYASFYAKFLHGDLALETVTKYHLTNYFHFEPLFLVLGAMLIEVLMGLFFVLGFEIRFAALFFLVFMTMSLIFFGEAVWPHIILIGTCLSMFTHGYDRYTLTAWLQKRDDLEPVI